MFVAPAIMMGLRALKVDLKEHVLITWISLAFGALFSLGVCYSIYARLVRIRSEEMVKRSPKSVRVGKEEAAEQLTPAEYDLRSLKKLTTGVLSACVISVVLGQYFKVQQPILLQAIMQPISVLSHPLFQLHIRGKTAEGNLSRPFKEDASPFESLTKPSEGDSTPSGDAGEKLAEGSGSNATTGKKED